ncbi:MAG: nucleotidyltransferase family protein [Candidatus Bathyarchaeota archaeon]|nr:nucleotidyltransferase family protein [Candidatus Bathyarchaeota archaeon]
MVQSFSSVRSLEEIVEQLRLLKPALKVRFKVETLDVFGSYARGEQNEKSDLDLLVTYCDPVSLFTVYDLKQFLRQRLQLKVDVVSKDYLNRHIRDQVLKEAVSV